MNGLIDGALRRHNFGTRLLAYEVVKEAQEILESLVPIVKGDAMVISYKDNALHIACRHSAARATVEGINEQLRLAIGRKSEVTQVITRLDPKIFTPEW